jgi:hypothetical protein
VPQDQLCKHVMNYSYSRPSAYQKPSQIVADIGGPNIQMSEASEWDLEKYKQRLKMLGLDGGMLEKAGEKKQEVIDWKNGLGSKMTGAVKDAAKSVAKDVAKDAAKTAVTSM